MTAFKLKGQALKVSGLSKFDIEMCFKLFSMYYDNVDKKRFMNDLNEKDWIIILKDRDGHIQGFSTLMLIELNVDGILYKCIFSGDTIIHKEYWRELELPKIWGRFVFSLIKDFPHFEFYWFLITKGYKTYKFLPVYFKNFYPSYLKQTPELEKKLMDKFGNMKFPKNYDSKTGIIRFNGTRDFLKANVAEVTEKRLQDPHIAYFTKTNPGYYVGDELLCVAKISKDNMNPIVHRYFLKEEY